MSCTNCGKIVLNKSSKLCVLCSKYTVNKNFVECVICGELEELNKIKKHVCKNCHVTHDTTNKKTCKKCKCVCYLLKNNEVCKDCFCAKCKICLKIIIDQQNIRFFGDIICDDCNVPVCNYIHDLCQLDKAKCCICKDNRPCNIKCNTYVNYIDGIGEVKDVFRWEFYCPSCKENCNNMYKLKNK